MSNILISILAGLGGMFGWGVSDYFANLSSDTIGHIKTFFWSQVVGFALIALTVLVFVPNFDFSLNLLPLLLFSILGYVFGYIFFYKAFEVGNVSVVSVVINFNAVLTMLVAYFLFEQRLTGMQIPGVFLIILGVMLVSVDFKDLLKGEKDILVKGAKEALIASLGFGAIYWPVTEYLVERTNWLWESLFAKALTIIFMIVFSIFSKNKLKLKSKNRSILTALILIGLLEAFAILSVNFGFTIGDSILISPIANSVAIVTVSMAVVFLKEKISKVQALGILATVAGIIITAI